MEIRHFKTFQQLITILVGGRTRLENSNVFSIYIYPYNENMENYGLLLS